MTTTVPLFDDYVAREVDAETFDPLFNEWRPRVFAQLVEFPFWSRASDDAKAARDALRERTAGRLVINWIVERNGALVGWSTGVQRTADQFFMTNSAVLPEHRGKGVYSALLRVVLERVRAAGFQVAVSHHHPTNRAVLIPKLRTGFVISGMEINDVYGLLVTLSYFFDERRREAYAVRVGTQRPGAELASTMRVAGD